MWALLALGACAEGDGGPGGAGQVKPGAAVPAHQVRVVSTRGEYAFEPAEVLVRAGDRVRFVLVGPQPQSIAFDTLGAPPAARQFIRARALGRGPLLTVPGQTYEVSFRGAPPGRYPFRSLSHGAIGMRGTVVVAPGDG